LIHLPEKKFRRVKGYQEILLLKERLVACLKFSGLVEILSGSFCLADLANFHSYFEYHLSLRAGDRQILDYRFFPRISNDKRAAGQEIG